MFTNVGEESKAERRSSTAWQCQWQAGGFTHIGGRGTELEGRCYDASCAEAYCVELPADHQEDRGVIIPDFNKYGVHAAALWQPLSARAE